VEKGIKLFEMKKANSSPEGIPEAQEGPLNTK
jgi:hypothetical protein